MSTTTQAPSPSSSPAASPSTHTTTSTTASATGPATASPAESSNETSPSTTRPTRYFPRSTLESERFRPFATDVEELVDEEGKPLANAKSGVPNLALPLALAGAVVISIVAFRRRG